MKPKKIAWARLLDFAPFILLIVLLLVLSSIDNRIIEGSNLLQIMIQAAPIAILSLGAMAVLISGGIDLSAGYGVGLCSVVFSLALTGGSSLLTSILLGLFVGVLIGCFNGFFIGTLNLPPFIVTLASMTVVQGATLFLATSGVLIVTNPKLKWIGIGSTYGIPHILMAAVLLIVVFSLIFRKTSFGVWTYSIGSSLESSKASGVPIIRQQYLIYIFSGVCTALTAMLLVSRTAIVSANFGGNNLLLDALTATVIGGTSIFGGKGSIVGTIIGAVMISLVTYSLTVFGVSASSLDFFKGLIIIAALIADTVLRQKQSKLNGNKHLLSA